jgi:hypothetical protein
MLTDDERPHSGARRTGSGGGTRRRGGAGTGPPRRGLDSSRQRGRTPPAGAVFRTRFWHPRDRRWNENFFESLDHALHIFVEESGWVLRQQQALDRPHAREMIFEAHREDFSRPSAEEMLRDVGLTPRDVQGLIERARRQ